MPEIPKIFVIGMFKTGLASTELAFYKLGYRVFRNNPFFLLKWFDKDIMVSNGEYLDETQYNSDIIEAMNRFDVGSHHPFMFIYPWLDTTFPNSKFILTQRDVGHVIKSTMNQIKYVKDFRSIYSEDKIASRYLSHQSSVIDYFKGSKNLLTMNYEQGDGWGKLCEFLNIPAPKTDFPHDHKGDYTPENS